MAALDLLGRRWALRVLWELREGAHTFRALQQACAGISPAVLNTRLRELRDVDVVERTDDGYALAPAGRELCRALAPLEMWSRRWAKALAD
jgi:DNA-binding HxlR family transcriptional regulator